MERRSRFGDQVFRNIGIFTSRIFGENSYAKNRIFDERISHSQVVTGIQKLADGISLADFKLSKSAQMGYIIGLTDLQRLDLARLNFVSMWATGQQSDVVVNRAAGSLFSQWYQKNDNPQRFRQGYQTALIHFMSGITGEKGFVNQMISKIHLLSDEDCKQYIERWFTNVHLHLGDLDPTMSINSSNLDLKHSQDIINFLFSEIDSRSLDVVQVEELNMDEGPNFLPELSIPTNLIAELNYQSPVETAARFIKNELVPMINLVHVGLMQWFSTNVISKGNVNLIGIPNISLSSDKDYLDFPESIDGLFARCSIFDLSEYSHSRSKVRDNFQLKYSMIMVGNEPLIDRFGDPVRINYGVLNLLYNELEDLLVNEIIGMVHMRRAFNLRKTKQGTWSAGSVLAPTDTSLSSKTNFVVDQLFEQVGKLAAVGQQHFDSLSYAHSLSSFVRYLKDDQWIEIGDDFSEVNKETRLTLYWIYQSRFIDTLDIEERVKLP